MPNAVLIVGRAENVKSVKDLITRLDQPAFPGAQFQVFHLQYADCLVVQTTIQNAFPPNIGLSPYLRVTADTRTNSLIVQASPRDLAEVASLIEKIDVNTGRQTNEVRIIQLVHTRAQDIVTVLNSAILASTTTAAGGNAAVPGGPRRPAAGRRGPAGRREALLPTGSGPRPSAS